MAEYDFGLNDRFASPAFDFGQDDKFEDYVPTPQPRPREAPRPIPQSFDPFGLSKGPNPRANFDEPPQVAVAPEVSDRLARKGLAPASPTPPEDTLLDYPVEGGKAYLEQGKNLAAGALKGYGAARPVMAERQIEALDQINAPLNGLFGHKIREQLYPGEDDYFQNNPHVSGMASETGEIILNPYSRGVNRGAVAKNEAFRLELRKRSVTPDFDLTDEQRAAFRGTPYENDEAALKSTIAARVYSGDPSARATPEQRAWVEQFSTTPQERAAYRLRRGVQHPAPEVIAERRAALEPIARTPIKEQPLYRAGQAIEEFGKDTLGAKPGWEDSWTRGIGGGFGSMTAGVALSMIPAVGKTAAASVFMGAGMGEAVDRALKQGATEEQARKAAEMGTMAGATDMVDALLPALGSTGRALGFIRRVGTRAVFGALAEGGQEGVQQVILNAIARGIYKPDQDLLEDVPRSVAIGMIVGGVTSGGFSALEGRGQQEARARVAPSAPAEQPVAPATPVQPESGVVSPQQAPTPPPREAPVSVPPEGQQPPAAPPALTPLPPEAPPPNYRPLPTTPPEPQGEIAAEPPTPEQAAVLEQYGYSPDQIAAMSPLQREAEYEDAIAAGVTHPPIPENPPTHSGEPTHPFQREAEYEDAIAAGVADSGTQDEKIAASARTEPAELDVSSSQPLADAETPPQPGYDFGQDDEVADLLRQGARIGAFDDILAEGTRAAPVEIQTGEDVAAAAAAANPDHTAPQGAANNRQLGHAKWQGLPVSIEAPAGGVRRGKTPTGEDFEQSFTHAYGYFKGVKGKDGDNIDVFFGPNPDSAPDVYVLNENDRNTGKFRQTKSFVGFNTEADVRAAYLGTQGKNEAQIGGITAMPVDEYKDWLRTHDHGRPVKMAKSFQKRTAPSGQQRPLSLLQFIASRGGIRPDVGGELKSLGFGSKSRVVVPGMGFRSIVRGGGMDLDQMREAAVEAGYLNDPARFTGGQLQITTADLLDAMREEGHGQRRVPMGEEGAEAEARAKTDREAAEDQFEGYRQDVIAALREVGEEPDEYVDAAAQLVATQGLDPLDAHERATMRAEFPEDVIEQAYPEGTVDDVFASGPQEGGEPARSEGPEEGVDERAQAGEDFGQEDETVEREAVPERPLPETPEREAGGEPDERGGRTETISVEVTKQDGFRDTWRAENEFGWVGASADPGQRLVEIHASSLRAGTPTGQGYGGALYRAIIDKALAEGYVVESSRAVSKDARRVYEGLQRRGYTVELVNPEGMKGDRAPVYRVTAAPAEEVGAEGKPQLVIPGAEKISEAEQAQRGAEKPLKSKVAQKPADEGLFGDESQQTDLVEQAGKRDDVTAAFDDIFGEETPAEAEARFAIDNVSSRRTQGTETAFGKYQGYASTNEGGRLSVSAYGDTAADAQRNAVAKLKREFTERTEKRAPTKAQLASSAAKGAARGTSNAIKGLGELFSPKSKLGSGISFDEETWAKAKPLFLEAARDFAGAWQDVAQLGRMLVDELQAAGYGMDTLRNMRPYLERFVRDVRDGRIELDQEQAEPAEEDAAAEAVLRAAEKNQAIAQILRRIKGGESFKDAARDNFAKLMGLMGDKNLFPSIPTGEDFEAAALKFEPEIPIEPPVSETAPDTLADAFAEHFAKGEGFPTIIQARKLAKDGGYTTDPKEIEEALELAVVMEARRIAQKPDAFNNLVDLYERQPRLGTRTSTQMRDQAFSTPVPLAYVASRLADIRGGKVIYEPSAGNGALLIEADPDKQNVFANEINPARKANLDAQGFIAHGRDAAEWVVHFANKGADRIIANPPFGAVTEEGEVKGQSKVFDMGFVQRGYKTREIDHAIALRALSELTKNGRAVLIVGGLPKTAVSEEARSNGYNSKSKREFYKVLYDNYGVTDHFTVAGELYERQGAGWPVDVIVIEGRKKSDRPLPAVEPPRILKTWDELAELIHDERPRRTEEDGDVAAPGPDHGAQGGDVGVRAPSQRPSEQPAGPEQPASVGERSVRRPRDQQPRAGEQVEPGERGEPARPDTAPPPQRRPSRVETETDKQVAYKPQSRSDGLGTLVPINMKTPIADSLSAAQKRHGDLDTFVAKELGYSKNELHTYFAAEQIDALALAIDNIKRGKGFIIGDQTGIGKGRVNAGIIRWAIKNERIPIFVTEKPNLYGDMYRDLTDISIQGYLDREPRILVTNAGLQMPLDEDGKVKIRTGEPAIHNSLLDSTNAENFGDSYDMVFTNYSQMQTVKQGDTPRRRFLTTIAPNSVVIFDESHNAGGQTATRMPKGAPQNRSGFARDLVSAANGVFYSSATYAKRPDVMDLYSKTDMAMAVDDPKDLGPTIQKGGVPMQQVVASMLSKAGQYIRRERSFAGITYDSPSIPVSRDVYDNISHSLADIQEFSELVRKATKAIDKQLKAEAKGINRDNATGGAGAQSTMFSSLMHNIVNQMLLAMKASPAAKMAIESIKRGEKPVLTVANTMETFLTDYAEQIGLAPGQPLNATFRDVLLKYLERTRTITIKKPFSAEKGEKKYLSDAELGGTGVAMYKRAKQKIEALDIGDLKVSPIDAIKDEIRAAGYKVGEITGRGTYVDYSVAEPILRSRPGNETSIAGRRKTIASFNNGTFDALILNQAGATGLSLHASEKFKDQKKRHMMIVQPEANIDTHMQLLGRVHRTGQVILPTYSQLVADIPAEKRPAAVLAKKMASLNANTTASRGGALTSEKVPDFLNEYGDMVAAAYIAEDPRMNARLGHPVKLLESGGLDAEDAMRKLTGRIPLLPLKEQESLYEHLEAEYDALLKQMDAAGENALEAKTLKLDAETLGRAEVVPAKDQSGSPFAAPVVVEKVSAKRLGKPYPSDEVVRRVAEQLGEPTDITKENAGNALVRMQDRGRNTTKNEVSAALEKFRVWERGILDDIEDGPTQENERQRLDAIRDRYEALRGLLHVGARVTLKTSNGNLTGIVLKIEQKGKTKNPLALSGWKATVALADASRQVTLPFSRLWEDGKASQDDRFAIEVAPIQDWLEDARKTLDRFDHLQSDTREERYLATGNLLAAYDWLNNRGRIVNYTDAEGNVRQGILTPHDFDFEKHAGEKGRTLSGPEVESWLREHPHTELASDDDVVRLAFMRSGEMKIMVKRAKNVGGPFYLDRDLTGIVGDFYSRGGSMQAAATGGDITKAIERLQKLGAKFSETAEAPKMTGVAEQLTPRDEWSLFENRQRNQRKLRELEDAPPKRGLGHQSPDLRAPGYLTPEARAKQRQIVDAVAASVRFIAGPGVKVEALENLGKPQTAQAYGTFYNPAEEDKYMVAGRYNAAGRILQFSFKSTDLTGTILHEVYHDIEAWMQTDQEREISILETPRLGEFVLNNATGSKPYTREDIETMAGYEIRAEAFRIYALKRARGEHPTGVHIAMMRFFEKLRALARRVVNAMSGLGFQTAEDIFGRYYEGGAAKRAPKLRKGVYQTTEQIVRPRSGNLPVPQITMPAETVREALNDPTLTSRERLSAALDALMLTPSRALWDKLIDLSRLQKAAELATGASTPERLDTYLAATLYPGRTGERLNDASHDLFRPIYDEMKARKVRDAELHEYLYARHAQERNEAIRKIDPDNDAGSGMSDQDADDILDRVQRSGRKADFDEIAALVDQVVAFNRGLMEKEGLESSKTLLRWTDAYDFYIPLKGAEAPDSENAPSPSLSRGYDVRRPESRRALGRFDKADSILANLLDQTHRTIIRAEKNRVAKTFLRFAQRNPSPLYKFGLAEQRRQINPQTGLVETVWVTTNADADSVFAAKVGGKTYYIKIEHEGLLTALKDVGVDRLNPMFRLIAAFTRNYSALQTARNPEFVLTNFARDIQEAGLNLSAEQRKGFKRAFMKNMLSGRAMLTAILGESHPDTRWGKLYDEWRLAGGKISTWGYKDVETIRRDIVREMARRTESTAKKIAMQPLRLINPVSGHVVKLFEALSDVTESTTRLAVYGAARDIGLSQAQAAKAARQITIDFNAQGKYGPTMKAFYAFSNPAIQGTVNLMRRLRKSRVMRAYAGSLAATGFSLALWNMWMGGGGDDDDERSNYERKPYWEREQNIILYFPSRKDAIKIPMGFALRPFMMAGENAALAMFGKKTTPLEAFGNWLGTSAKAFNPFGAEGPIWSTYFWIQTALPTIAEPLVQLGMNLNWLGRPIHPEEQRMTRGLPRSSQSKSTTSPIAESVAETLNRWTGGNAFKKGTVDLYPDDLEYTWNFLLGGMGKFILNSGSMTQDMIEGAPTPIEKTPIIRRFVSPDNTIGAVRSDFFEKSREARDAVNTVEQAIKEVKRGGPDSEAAREAIKELSPKVGRYRGESDGTNFHAENVYGDAWKRLNALRIQERKIRNNSEIPRDLRAMQLERNHQEQIRIMRGANRRYRQMQPPEARP